MRLSCARGRETPSTINRDRESLQLPRRRRRVPAPHLPEQQREVDPPVLVALPEPKRVRLVVQRAVEDDDAVLAVGDRDVLVGRRPQQLVRKLVAGFHCHHNRNEIHKNLNIHYLN